MKQNYYTLEKNKLPLVYKYMEVVKDKTRDHKQFSMTIGCEKYQTDFHVKLKPHKFLTRII
ncbi:hypothetical protein DRF67_13015 [Chryseobacterium pennipullorum]|uniref:Uncharacterized protein n=1 Tax=Chryseobacterium pennipullorum TaxID=2258963 RepID=A0A3D9AZG1_9FLAO|nr:hypothetical protein DRF67_13015 [Chryseobacterium pennipullorum]